MTRHSVVIAGGGPTGLMLAAELRLAGVDALIIERFPTRDRPGSRGLGMHARTIEILDQRGVAGRFVSQGETNSTVGFHTLPMSLSDFPSRHNYTLGLVQKRSEQILAGWVLDELRAPIQYGVEVTGFAQDEAGVDVHLSDGRSLRAAYLVGCDGGRSVIRKSAGIEFPGSDPTKSWLIAEAHVREEPAWGFKETETGNHGIGKLGEDGKTIRTVLVEAELKTASDPTLDEVKAALVSVFGSDYGIHSPIWISRFTDMTRQAARYRKGRVLLAGDAAHVHPPMGGQGLNLGMQDAMNLGWKLAQVAKGDSSESLLDTYQTERHPVAARALRTTMVHVALSRPDERTKAVVAMLGELVRMDEPRKALAGDMTGLGIRYELGEGHPLLGRRMPDLDVITSGGSVRVFSLLHQARPVLLNFKAPGSIDIGAWADRVQLVDAKYRGTWDIPVIGVAPAPPAVLIRPDGYVAWAGDQGQSGLVDALSRWFETSLRQRNS